MISGVGIWLYIRRVSDLWALSSDRFFIIYIRHSRTLKMLCLYLLGQYCLHLTFEPYLSSKTYSRKYEKLPNIVIQASKNNTEKMYLLKTSGPQIWLCLFMFRPLTSKKLNGLTTTDTLSWLGRAVVTHLLWVQEVQGSIPSSGKYFYVWCFVLLLLCFNFFCQKKNYLWQKFGIPFTILIYLVYLRHYKIYDRL